jgi:hypothetical protein
MTTVRTDAGEIQIRLTAAEKIGALHGDVNIPRSAVTEAVMVDDGLAAVRGLRAPGLALPGRIKLGTWRGRGRRSFVAVRRGEPALRLALTGHKFDSVIVSTPDAEALAEELRVGQAR